MSKKSRTRLLAPAFAAFVGLLLVACGSATEQAAPEEEAPPPAAVAAPAAAPSDTAPSPASAAGDTIVADAPDASQFPPVEPSELKVDPPRDVPEELKIIWEAWQLLHQDYVDRSQLDPEAFSEQAIRGMLRVLEDPQTAYVSPEVLSGSFQDVFHGEFEGIGAHVQMNADGNLVIVSPVEGSPAEAAGIRPGDIVLEVNGESLEDLSILEAVAKIRGPKGTEVNAAHQAFDLPRTGGDNVAPRAHTAHQCPPEEPAGRSVCATLGLPTSIQIPSTPCVECSPRRSKAGPRA